MQKEYRSLPMVPLRGIVVFPNTVINFEVARQTSVDAVNHAVEQDSYIFLATQKNLRMESPAKKDIYTTGVLCKMKHVLKLQDGALRILANGISRARMLDCWVDGHYYADVQECEELPVDGRFGHAYMRALLNAYEDYAQVTGKVSMETVYALQDITSEQELVDTVALTFVNKIEDKQDLLDTLDIQVRYKKLIELIEQEKNIGELEREITKSTRVRMEKMQKEAYLREQIKSMQISLGDDDVEGEVQGFKEFIASMPVEDDIKEKLYKEAARMERMNPQSPDYNVLLNYFEWITALPYGRYTEDTVDIAKAKKTLDKKHYGMDKVKERILEYLSVFSLTGKLQGNILCFVGPPGVGKTSIASCIAEAIGRKFVRMSLGGVRDEAEIRGHRRTYIGAVPGRIISNIRRAGTMNPVFLLDEIDKMASDYKGDPTSAMLEVLDESVNTAFQDHYLDIDFDLSQVMFIATANNAEDIPPALYDRLEIIELESYTPYEKEQIANKHLIPKQLEKNGLTKEMLKIQPAAVRAIISEYTVESGVRSLEREIGVLCRKAAKKYVEQNQSIAIGKKDLAEYLGKPKHLETQLPDKPCVGVAVGLAWTYAGGTTLPVEVSAMEGSGNIELTGQLGDVMKESAKTAISHVRAISGSLGIDGEFYKNKDIHIHVPEGAVPKDGPSAGITMALAVSSALTGRKVRRDIAMTGEITLVGRVLMIGGLREKAFAAYRAGIREIIIPKENVRDIQDIPKEIREKLQFHPVTHFEEVLRLGLMKEKA